MADGPFSGPIPGCKPRSTDFRRSRIIDAPKDVRWSEPAFPNTLPRHGAKRDGVLFEREVSKVLSCVRPPWFYVPSAWIRYTDQGILRHAQPDGLLLNFQTGDVVICEMKLRHTQRAEGQLADLYAPLIRQLFPAPLWRVSCVEIFKVWDHVRSGMVRTECWEVGAWHGVMCYGWRGELPAGLRETV